MYKFRCFLSFLDSLAAILKFYYVFLKVQLVATVSQQNWLIQKLLLKILSLNTPFYGTYIFKGFAINLIEKKGMYNNNYCSSPQCTHHNN